jgi:hypothetical protein
MSGLPHERGQSQTVERREELFRSRVRLRHLTSSALVLAFALSLTPLRSFAQYPAHPATTAAITAADLSARDKALSDDAFQGRGPGTVAGEAAADWIADEMKRIGLRPGNHGSYFQPVPAVTITLDAAKSSFTFNTPHGALTPKFPEDTVYWSPQFASDTVKVAASPLIFVGYGVVAPEYKWDDYAGVDECACTLSVSPGTVSNYLHGRNGLAVSACSESLPSS